MDNPGEGHRDRLRGKFLRHGLNKFTDEEALELLLTLATPRQDCKQRARRLLQRFGSLSRALEAEAEELAAIEGLGPKNILGLKLVPAVAGRYLQDMAAVPQGGDVTHILPYLRFALAGLRHEIFKIILLDSAHTLCGE
jgi:DNA repair protein RadC